ncbi:hypothetical protein FRC01_011991 [Tulasnella sp. 417]|nr:hypothetical protein FRC01_011991 [Tulasnella sp. 417]
MSYPAPFNCEPEEIEFLSDILEDLEAVIGDTGARAAQATQLKAVKSVLSEALERHRLGGDGNGLDESQNLSQRECAVGDSSHSVNGSSGEEWEFERLCKWILNQVQAAGLECQGIINKLQARCGTADAATAKGNPIQARQYNNPLGEAVESHSNSCYISLLPVEVLEQIFWLAASPHIWVQAPLVLSHINSYFRGIVLDTPSLWVALDESLSLPILKLYAAHSRNEPLDIFTKIDHILSAIMTADWIDFLNMESGRIRQMAIATSISGNLTMWTKALEPLIFTSLTRLTVHSMDSTDDVSTSPIWACFPRLRDLCLEGCWSPGWVGYHDQFPQSLRSLRLTKIFEVFRSNLLEALSGVWDLVRLAMDDFDLQLYERNRPVTTQVTLTSLEELEFANVPVDDMNEISQLVATPNLSSLSITSPRPSDEIANFAFLATFTAKHPHLSSLSIFGFNLESQELEMMLHKLPNLTQLHMHASELTDNHAAFLENKTTLFPRLTLIVS